MNALIPARAIAQTCARQAASRPAPRGVLRGPWRGKDPHRRRQDQIARVGPASGMRDPAAEPDQVGVAQGDTVQRKRGVCRVGKAGLVQQLKQAVALDVVGICRDPVRGDHHGVAARVGRAGCVEDGAVGLCGDHHRGLASMRAQDVVELSAEEFVGAGRDGLFASPRRYLGKNAVSRIDRFAEHDQVASRASLSEQIRRGRQCGDAAWVLCADRGAVVEHEVGRGGGIDGHRHAMLAGRRLALGCDGA
jgi:hypothetical protein